jgi:hypothetical protein
MIPVIAAIGDGGDCGGEGDFGVKKYVVKLSCEESEQLEVLIRKEEARRGGC